MKQERVQQIIKTMLLDQTLTKEKQDCSWISPWARGRNHAGEEEVDLEVGEADPIGDELKRRKRPPSLRSPGNSSCTPTYYQRGMETRPPEDDAVATQHCSTPPLFHKGGGRRIIEERKEDSTAAAPILIGDRFRRGGKRGRWFHLPARARLSHPRARQSPPNPPAARHNQPSSRETNPNSVSRRPGAGTPFGCARPGCGLGQPHKQGALQPEGTTDLLGHPRKHTPDLVRQYKVSYVVLNVIAICVHLFMVTKVLMDPHHIY